MTNTSTTRWAIPLVALAALTVLFLGCSSDDEPEPLTQEELLDLGQTVWGSNCAICHGGALDGSTNGPSHLAPVYGPDQTSDAEFREAIVNGAPQQHFTFGPMPAFPGLPDQEVDAVIAFMRAAQEQLGMQG